MMYFAIVGRYTSADRADTPAFAVAALARWWEDEGQVAYPEAKQILILADSGGSNGCRPRM
jgi:hypothetical protein